MGNTLRIVTPYKTFKNINSDFKLYFVQSKHYLFNLGLSFQNDSIPITVSKIAFIVWFWNIFIFAFPDQCFS